MSEKTDRTDRGEHVFGKIIFNLMSAFRHLVAYRVLQRQPKGGEN